MVISGYILEILQVLFIEDFGVVGYYLKQIKVVHQELFILFEINDWRYKWKILILLLNKIIIWWKYLLNLLRFKQKIKI